MVAAAPKEGVLKPWVAFLLFAGVIAAMALVMIMSGRTSLYRQMPLPYSPDVLAVRAAETTRKLGYNQPPTDTAHGFFLDDDYLAYRTPEIHRPLVGRNSEPDNPQRSTSGIARALATLNRAIAGGLRSQTHRTMCQAWCA